MNTMVSTNLNILTSTNNCEKSPNLNVQQLEDVILKEFLSVKNYFKKEIQDMGVKLAQCLGAQMNDIEKCFFESMPTNTDVNRSTHSENENCSDLLSSISEMTDQRLLMPNIFPKFTFDGLETNILTETDYHQELTSGKESNNNNQEQHHINQNIDCGLKNTIDLVSDSPSDNDNRASDEIIETSENLTLNNPDFPELEIGNSSTSDKSCSINQLENYSKSYAAVIKYEKLDESKIFSDLETTENIENKPRTLFSSSMDFVSKKAKKKSKVKALVKHNVNTRSNICFHSNDSVKNQAALSKRSFRSNTKTNMLYSLRNRKEITKKYLLNYNAFHCAMCNKSFANKNQLVLHKASHLSARLPCCICKKRFTARGMKKHMEVHKSDQENNNNNDIDDDNDDPNNVSTDDDDDCEMECSICNQVMFTNRTFNFHMQSHLKQKTFVCKFCSKMFFSLKKLYLHMNQHNKKASIKSIKRS